MYALRSSFTVSVIWHQLQMTLSSSRLESAAVFFKYLNGSILIVWIYTHIHHYHHYHHCTNSSSLSLIILIIIITDINSDQCNHPSCHRLGLSPTQDFSSRL